MIADKPRPKYPYTAPRFPGPRQRLTLIGAIRAGSDVVLLADRQETIPDYAKWDCGKINHFEMQDTYRILFAGAGDSDFIDMVRDEFEDRWSKINATDTPTLRRSALEVFSTVVRHFPTDERPHVEIIWAIQQTKKFERVALFRTHGFHANQIRRHHFTGNPILLSRYLSDMYIENQLVTREAAEALAAYIMWECKEYDPTVGKHSDIVSLGFDGTLRQMSRIEEAHWEAHFYELKKALRIMPILSCSDAISKVIYDKEDHIARFKVTLDLLIEEQEKLRKGVRDDHSLGKAVADAVRRDYQERQRLKQSDSQTLGDQQ
jgi:hypothetical protein